MCVAEVEEDELSASRLLHVDAVSAADEDDTTDEGGRGGRVERSGRSFEEMVASSRLSLSIPIELQSPSSCELESSCCEAVLSLRWLGRDGTGEDCLGGAVGAILSLSDVVEGCLDEEDD